jgi:flagellar basal body-associated protein FliL
MPKGKTQETMMITALTILAVLIASMFLATMGAAMLAMQREQAEATESARTRTKR